MRTINKRYKFCLLSILLIFTLLLSNCKKFIDVGAPNGQLVAATAFKDDNSVKATLAGMYTTLAGNADNMQLTLSFGTGNSSDEMQFYISTADYDPFFTNTLAPATPLVGALWSDLYTSIYSSNAVIAGVNANTSNLSQPLVKEALGEAKFIRAFCYFYLVNLWGDVPLSLTTDVNTNKLLTRTSKALIYQQIIADLNEAKTNLPADYSFSGGERIRPNSFAAAALLARVYLYTNNWVDAQSNASTVISNQSLYNLLPQTQLDGIFLKDNTEAIWQLTGVNLSDFTIEGQSYYPSSNVPNYLLTNTLVKSFEQGDQRFNNWVGIATIDKTTYYYPNKYKQYNPNTDATAEYCTYFRLAEQYLVRAEAMAQQGNLTGAVTDINVIRNRAGLSKTSATTQSAILQAIYQERRIELFGEYGHRWNDLKRTGQADAVLSASKPGWTAFDALYPLPKYDRDNDLNLTQNPGY